MGKAEAGSTKAAANAVKAKGLGRLRWYCQVCEKQCRDENGFQAHCRAESHLRKILTLGPKAGSAINDFSTQFQSEFLTLLRTRHLTNRVQANKVYNEYIQDKHHVHMNSTRWVTLGGFVATLGKAGLVRVEEDEKGLWVTWVDTRPETLSKQAALQKRDRATMDGEERERLALQDQIQRAKAQEALRIAAEGGSEDTGLQKKEGEKITLSFQPVSVSAPSVPIPSADETPNASASGSSSTPAIGGTSISFGGTSLPTSSSSSMAIPSKSTNPLKRPASTNVFKTKAPKVAKTEEGADGAGGSGAPKKYTSEAERLMREDQARKAGRGGGSGGAGYGGFGPVRTNKPNLGRTY